VSATSTGFSVSRLFARPAPDGSHPLVRAEREAGVSATEAARRLGVSPRQYMRYKLTRAVPKSVCLLVELGALRREPRPTLLEEHLKQWNPP
jgi:hypothetical protein